MDRVQFFESISGINYPHMLVNFFDHFLALKEIVDSSGKIFVKENQPENNHIIFEIQFTNKKAKDTCINLISSCNGNILIYNRLIYINIIGLSVDNTIVIELY